MEPRVPCDLTIQRPPDWTEVAHLTLRQLVIACWPKSLLSRKLSQVQRVWIETVQQGSHCSNHAGDSRAASLQRFCFVFPVERWKGNTELEAEGSWETGVGGGATVMSGSEKPRA